jgi:hypothetical protein
MTPTFTGIEVPAILNTGTLPAKRADVVKDLLARLAGEVLPHEPEFEHFAADAACNGASHVYDSHSQQEVPITPVEFNQLLPLVGCGDQVLFDRRIWRDVETRQRIVRVECTERVRVCVIALHGGPKELFAHVRVTIEGDYYAS